MDGTEPQFVPKEHRYDMTPEPQKYGFCRCCNKPMSEHDWVNSQGHHCAECFSHFVFDDKYFYCSLHDELPAHLKTPIQKLIDSKAYMNRTLDEFIQKSVK